MRSYMVNEMFYSLQGEGVRAGTANVFVRFSGCNLTCTRDGEAGFDCDTEFTSGRRLTLAELLEGMNALWPSGWMAKACVLTGGEPMLQVDAELVQALHADGWYVAMETNGTVALSDTGIDWVCVSPKSAEHTLKVTRAHEVKYVRHAGQGVPRPTVTADHYLLSPAFTTLVGPGGHQSFEPHPGAMLWCVKLVQENPTWRLSVQQHKAWSVR